MLLNAVIIIVREILEAAVLLSVLAVLTRRLGFSVHWLWISITVGVAGAVSYALALDPVSELFDGFGQEIINAFMQLGMFCLLGVLIVALGRMQVGEGGRGSNRVMLWIVLAAPCLAISREGSELIVYVSSFWPDFTQRASFMLGVTIGSSIGLSIGVLTYFALRSLSHKYQIPTVLTLLILMASGMTSQASLLLIQADWLPAQMPLWNTSAWLDETSVGGQFLYATMSYEATPTAIQACVYFGAMGLLTLLYVGSRHFWRNQVTGVTFRQKIAT